MFWSVETIKCEGGCAVEYFLPVRDIHLYTEGDTDLRPENINTSAAFLPVLKQRAWCVSCNNPVLAERLPSSREFSNAVAVLRLPEEQRPDVDDDLLRHSIEEIRRLFEHLSRRSSPARCLACGAAEIIPVDVRSDGRLVPKLIHEACNSEFRLHGIVAGIIGRVSVRAYSFEGRLVAEGSAVS